MKTKMLAALSALLLVTSSTAVLAQTADGTAQAPTAASESAAPQTNDGYRDQADVQDRLEDRGYSEIELELEGSSYTGTAQLYGEKVDLEVDAGTGRVLAPTELSQDQLVNKLEDEGYDDVSELREAGDEFTATATRFDEEVDLRINRATGSVIDPRELSGDQVEQLLEDDDYSDITVFEREDDYGSVYAVADDDDETFLLEINPVTGEIVRELEER